MNLTIAIITRKRPESLAECLAGIYKQTEKKFGILIVDNDEERSAYPVFEKFSGIVDVPVSYVHEPVAGYTKARNCALKQCNTRYIGFIDDDCIPDKNWVSYGLAAILKYDSAYVVGNSRDSENETPYGFVENYIIDKIWKFADYDKHTLEMKAEKLDTKNLILDNNLLKALNIRFDERFNQYGGEDVDLGFQIKYKELKGYYVEDMVVHHKQKDTLSKYLRKAFSYGYNGQNLYNKWHHKNECSGWTGYKYYRFWHISNWIHLFKINRGNIIKNIYCFILYKAFNFYFLKGAAKSKKYFLKR